MKVEGVWGSYKQGYTFNYIPKSQTWRDKDLGEGGSGDGGGCLWGIQTVKETRILSLDSLSSCIQTLDSVAGEACIDLAPVIELVPFPSMTSS